jgi:hypothetical protein
MPISIEDVLKGNPQVTGHEPSKEDWIEFFRNYGKQKLTAPQSYYVRTDGIDTNTGLTNTAGGAFKTLQGAWNYIALNVNSCGFLITINVGAGTYEGVSDVGRPYLDGQVYFVGNIALPSAVIINETTAGDDCFLFGASNVVVAGFTLYSSGSCIHGAFNGKVTVGAGIVFGTCVEFHIFCDNGGMIGTGTTAYTVIGSAGQGHFYAHTTGWLGIGGVTITLVGNPNFGTAFAIAVQSGILEAPGLTFIGSCTGRRYVIEQGGNISTGNTANLNYFPGSIAGYNLAGFYDSLVAIGSPLSFSPQYGGSATLGTTTQSLSATYMKMGSLVFFTIRLVWTAANGTGNAIIAGLPFPCAYDTTCSIWHSGLTGTAGRNITTFIAGGTSSILLQASDPAGGSANSVAVEAAGDVLISGSYITLS